MKKSVKITITVVVLVALAVSISLNVALGTKCGIIESSSSLSGSVNEAWNKNDAHIPLDGSSAEWYYSGNGDHIYNIEFCGLVDENDIEIDNAFSIEYEQSFSRWDDLEAYFVIENSSGQRHTTRVETSHTPSGTDEIQFTIKNIELDGLYIAEVWVRTVD